MTRRAHTVVLLYHRVFAPERDPHSLCVTPDRFAEHLGVIRDRADIVPLDEVRDSVRNPRVAITFDDGYRDNLTFARPLLEQAGAPATVFVASRGLEAPKDFWFDHLEHLVLDATRRPDPLVVHTSGKEVHIDIRSEAGRARALDYLHRVLRPQRQREIQRSFDDLARQLGGDSEPASCEAHRRMSDQDLIDLTRDGLVTIGAHAKSHAALAGLEPSEQEDEIVGGKAALETIVGGPVRTFAYPFGDPASYDHASVDAVRAAGFDLAFTTEPGRVASRSSRFELPRYVVENWGADAFARRLERWLAANGD